MARVAKKDKEAQKKWEEKLARAKKVRKNWKDLFKVDIARDYFDGKQNPGWPAEEWLTINKVYSHLMARLPALYSADPYFYVKLRRSYKPNPMDIVMYEKKGKVRQNYLNYLKEELDLKPKVRLGVQDAHFAYGVAKVRYEADLKKNPTGGTPILGEDRLPLFGEEGEPILEPEEIPVNERYVIERVHPDDFLWDEDAGPLEDSWAWVGQCIRCTIDDLKKDRRYNRQAIRALESRGGSEPTEEEAKNRNERKKGGDIPSKLERHNQSIEGAKQEEPKVVYRWEIYHIKEKTWLVIVEGGEIPLIPESPLPPGIERHPFSVLRFTLRDDSPYPIPPISQGIDPQKEFNVARSRVMTHRKRFNRKYVATGPWEEQELSKIEAGDDGTVAKAQAGCMLEPIKDAPLDAMGTYTEISYLEKDMVELLGGSTQESRGIAGAESATQAGILDKRLEMKEGDAMSMVVDFVKVIARKLDQLVQTYITRDEAIRISGPEGEYWALVKAQDYQEVEGEFSYEVNVGATIPQMPQMERASWLGFLQFLGTNPAFMMSKRLLTKVAEMHHIEDESMIEEFGTVLKAIMMGVQGQAQGSAPNVSENNPQAAMGGQAGGPMSLAMPLAGNAVQ